MPLLFQYGSNCEATRLRERLGVLEDLGRAQTRDDYEIAFNKRTLKGYAAADLLKPRKGGQRVWGVLYQVSRAGLKKLTDIEGKSYRLQSIDIVDATGALKPARTFRVRQNKRHSDLHTTAEYVGHIVRGLRTHHVPEEYVQHVIDVAIQTKQGAAATEPAAEQSRQIEALRQPDSL